LTARAKKKRLTVTWSTKRRQRVPKMAPKGAQNGSYCLGNERCAVESLPVPCLFRVSPPDRASRLSCRFATIKVPLSPPTTLMSNSDGSRHDGF